MRRHVAMLTAVLFLGLSLSSQGVSAEEHIYPSGEQELFSPNCHRSLNCLDQQAALAVAEGTPNAIGGDDGDMVMGMVAILGVGVLLISIILYAKDQKENE